MNIGKNLNRVFLVLIVLVIAGGAWYYLRQGNPDQKSAASTAQPTTAAAIPEKETGESLPAPAVTPTSVPAKTADELKPAAESQNSAPADYNALAVAYYKQGHKDQALKTIGEGLEKYPGNDSLLKTQDLIENILPNL